MLQVETSVEHNKARREGMSIMSKAWTFHLSLRGHLLVLKRRDVADPEPWSFLARTS